MFIHSHKIEILEQASQLAQDIKTFLRFSTERRVISKVREQPNPNTNTIKDTKGKSVIGGPSKSAKGSQYFKCHGYGHIIAQCPFRSLFIKETDDDEIKTVIHEATDNATDSEDDVRVARIQFGVTKSTHIVVNN